MPSTETSSPPITAVLIDDHWVFLDAFTSLLDHDGRIQVVDAAATSATGVEAVRERRPNLVVLDVEIDGTPAEQTLRRILRMSPESVVVIITMHNHAPLREALLRSGARAFLSKSNGGAELIEALIKAVSSPAPATIRRPMRSEVSMLTQREHEVLRLISLAQSNRQISAELSISEGTVKRHAYSLFQKLGATSRIDAVRKAADLGLFT